MGCPDRPGPLAYWGVADITAEVQRLTQIGGTIHEPVKEVGGGIKVAALKDPFGNVFGLIENPNFNAQDVR